jgi:hypothetical protein
VLLRFAVETRSSKAISIADHTRRDRATKSS